MASLSLRTLRSSSTSLASLQSLSSASSGSLASADPTHPCTFPPSRPASSASVPPPPPDPTASVLPSPGSPFAASQLRLRSTLTVNHSHASENEAHSNDAHANNSSQHAPSHPPLIIDGSLAYKNLSGSDLVRQFLVLRSCQLPWLVKNADRLVNVSRKVLGDHLTGQLLRMTYFRVFCGGVDLDEVSGTVQRLQASRVMPILDFAAEADVHSDSGPKSRSPELRSAVARSYPYQDESESDRHALSFLQCIDQAREASDRSEGGAGKRPFAAVKITALGDPQLLQRLSDLLQAGSGRRPGDLTGAPGGALGLEGGATEASLVEAGRAAGWAEEELRLLQNLLRRATEVAGHAAARRVSVMIDAEQSYFQPAIDFLALQLMREFNRGEDAVVFQTIQAYRKDSRERLELQMRAAREEGFRFGVKLVRGAYMQMERARATRMDYPDPIFPSLADTHANYNACLEAALGAVKSSQVSLLVASHNQDSVVHATRLMARLQMPPAASNVYFGQLLGMSDYLTYALAAQGFQAYKYVPYGPILEVVPYLIRRAQENASLAGGVRVELGLLREEMVARVLGPLMDNPSRTVMVSVTIGGAALILIPLFGLL